MAAPCPGVDDLDGDGHVHHQSGLLHLKHRAWARADCRDATNASLVKVAPGHCVDVGALRRDRLLLKDRDRPVVDLLRSPSVARVAQKLDVGDLSALYHRLHLHGAVGGVFRASDVRPIFEAGGCAPAVLATVEVELLEVVAALAGATPTGWPPF